MSGAAGRALTVRPAATRVSSCRLRVARNRATPRAAQNPMRILSLSLLLVAATAGGAAPTRKHAKAKAEATPRAEAPVPATVGVQRPLSEVLTGPARVAYESGRLLLEADDSATAHAKFREAYELSKSPRLLWNMAACSKLQRRYARAVQELERFIHDGAGHITAEQEARARELVETLRVVVAPVTVRVDPARATLFVDGDARSTPDGVVQLLMDVGRHEFRAELVEHTEARRSIDIDETKSLEVDLRLAPVVPESSLMVATIAEAAVELDGHPFSVGSHEGVVPAGPHRVRVLARDYQPWASELVIGVGEHKSVTAMLEPEPRPNWWLIGTSAVLTVAAVGVGAYYMFKPEAPAAPPPVYLEPVPGSVATLPLP